MTQPQIPMLDTHQHLVYPEQWPYAWTEPAVPALAGKAFRQEDYAAQAKGTGIAGTLFMETGLDDPDWRREAPFVCELAARPGSLIRGVIANCRPEADGFEAYVDSIRHPLLVGFRRILHVVPDDVSRTPAFAENVRWLGRQSFTFDLCFLARQLPLAAQLIRECPGVQFILDHCGVPDIAAGQLDPWRQHVRDVAALPNVACKISGVLAYCKPGEATLEAVQPYVEYCIDSFGADRLVWGGDWPVVLITSDLRTWGDVSRQLVAKLSESEQRKVLHDNAVRLYRVGR